jgi:hypothetical protein
VLCVGGVGGRGVQILGENLQIWEFWLRNLRGGDRGAANLELLLVGGMGQAGWLVDGFAKS